MKQVKDNPGKIPPPPPLPLWRRKTVIIESVTNQEIANFWRQRRIQEEDHLLSAIKAAARMRARNLPEEDYKCFMESLEEKDGGKEGEANESQREIRVGIKDWWRKSKYAYLNQPAMESPKRRASSYVPNCFNFNPTTPLYPTSLGVF